MYNYMRELQRVFSEEPVCADLRREIQELRQGIGQQLSKDARKEFLRLMDKTTELSDRIALASFVSGFRLAAGITAELGQEVPFSFAQAEERRAFQGLRKEVGYESGGAGHIPCGGNTK